MHTELRAATRQDVDAIQAIMLGAFGWGSNPDRQAYVRHLAEDEFASFLVLEHARQAVAVLRLGRDSLQVGRSVIVKAEVGYVSVRRDLQGAGFGTALMQKAVAYMHGAGFHVSRLGGLMRFYARFGYEPFLRRYVMIPVAPLTAELKGTKWAALRAIPRDLMEHVRFYDPAHDHAAVHALRRAWNRGRPGSCMIGEPGPAPTAGPDPEQLAYVYEADGEICGYLGGAYALVHAGDPGPSYRIDDLALDPGRPEACEALLKTYIWKVAESAPTVINCRLPYDERLFSLITAANIAFDTVEMHQAADGNMMQVMDLPGVLDAVAPELTARLVDSGVRPWRGTVRFEIPGQHAVVRLGNARVCTCPGAEADAVVQTDHATLLKWLLGIGGFAEFAHVHSELSPRQRLALSILFPRLPCASGPWG